MDALTEVPSPAPGPAAASWRAEAETQRILREEAQAYHQACVEVLYAELGVDGSDGEIRFKWAHQALRHKLRDREAARAELRLLKDTAAEYDTRLELLEAVVAHAIPLIAAFEQGSDPSASHSQLALFKGALGQIPQAARPGQGEPDVG